MQRGIFCHMTNRNTVKRDLQMQPLTDTNYKLQPSRMTADTVREIPHIL